MLLQMYVHIYNFNYDESASATKLILENIKNSQFKKNQTIIIQKYVYSSKMKSSP